MISFLAALLTPSFSACQEGILDGECFLTFCNVVLDQVYCSVCTAMTEFLIDGECLSANRDFACRHSLGNGTCDSCAGPYLSYKGGCYKVDDEPGNYICAPEDVFYIDGTALCRKCKVHGEFPINGRCTSDSSGNVCGTKGYSGVCERCFNGYFYYNGGCYQKNRFPGNKICADAPGYEHAGYCNTCLEGYEKYKGQCLACTDANCRRCNVRASHCEVCNDGYYLDRNANSGQGECVPCSRSANCNTCISTDACTSCPLGYFAAFTGESGACLPCSRTVPGKGYKGVPKCHSCLPPSEDSPSLTVVCTDCEDGLYILTSDDGLETTCVDSCPEDKVPSVNRCVTKLNGCHKYGYNAECIACEKGYQLNGGHCKKCKVGNCDVCDHSISTCDACAASFGLVDNKCRLCGEKCRTCDGDASVCTACLVHMDYISPGRNACITTCPEHSWERVNGEVFYCACYADYRPSEDGLNCEK